MGKIDHVEKFIMKRSVESVPQGGWPKLSPILPTVVSSWLDVL
jgi:hypothetical protein